MFQTRYWSTLYCYAVKVLQVDDAAHTYEHRCTLPRTPIHSFVSLWSDGVTVDKYMYIYLYMNIA